MNEEAGEGEEDDIDAGKRPAEPATNFTVKKAKTFWGHTILHGFAG